MSRHLLGCRSAQSESCVSQEVTRLLLGLHILRNVGRTARFAGMAFCIDINVGTAYLPNPRELAL